MKILVSFIKRSINFSTGIIVFHNNCIQVFRSIFVISINFVFSWNFVITNNFVTSSFFAVFSFTFRSSPWRFSTWTFCFNDNCINVILWRFLATRLVFLATTSICLATSFTRTVGFLGLRFRGNFSVRIFIFFRFVGVCCKVIEINFFYETTDRMIN